MQDWSAWGVLWGDSWGNSWGPLHQVEEFRRPRTNPYLKLKKIQDARKAIRGTTDVLVAGTLAQKHVRPVLSLNKHALKQVHGGTERDVVGTITGRVSKTITLCGVADTSVAGSVVYRSGSCAKLLGFLERDLGSTVKPHAGTCFSVSGLSDADFCSGIDDATVVKNPTDEELVILTINLLTSRQNESKKFDSNTTYSGRHPVKPVTV